MAKLHARGRKVVARVTETWEEWDIDNDVLRKRILVYAFMSDGVILRKDAVRTTGPNGMSYGDDWKIGRTLKPEAKAKMKPEDIREYMLKRANEVHSKVGIRLIQNPRVGCSNQKVAIKFE